MRLRLASDDRLVGAIRGGDPVAFEVLYERHARELYSFCAYMLRSRHDAEDAVQATFASAYRALRANRRQVNLRPWLFAIARNACVSIQRRRRPTVELNGEPALGPDPVRELELREEVRVLIADLGTLPERQRTALVLTELHGLSQSEIAGVLGVRTEQVKAYVYQARSNLISERRARDTDCHQIREELATARGATLLKGGLRRHVRSCADCRVYAGAVARQRRQLAALLPLVPSLVLRHRTLEDVLGVGAADPATYAGAAVGAPVAGAAFEFAGGGIKALAVKLAAALAAVGASAGVGVSELVPHGGSQVPAAIAHAQRLIATADVQPDSGSSAGNSAGERSRGRGAAGAGALGGEGVALGGGQATTGPLGGEGEAPAVGSPVHGNGNAPGGEGGAMRGVSERAPKQPDTHGGDAGGQQSGKGGERRQTASEERVRSEEERLLAHGQRAQAHELRERALEARHEARAERERVREEGGPHTSRPPKSEEERKLTRERHELRREEREASAGEEPAGEAP